MKDRAGKKKVNKRLLEAYAAYAAYLLIKGKKPARAACEILRAEGASRLRVLRNRIGAAAVCPAGAANETGRQKQGRHRIAKAAARAALRRLI